jgi:hypothetical protein
VWIIHETFFAGCVRRICNVSKHRRERGWIIYFIARRSWFMDHLGGASQKARCFANPPLCYQKVKPLKSSAAGDKSTQAQKVTSLTAF